MSRGELITGYARLAGGATAEDCRKALQARYADEPFVALAPEGVNPATQYVRGSNNVMLAVYADRVPGRVILVLHPRQPGEGFGRPGHPEFQPDVRACRNIGA